MYQQGCVGTPILGSQYIVEPIHGTVYRPLASVHSCDATLTGDVAMTSPPAWNMDDVVYCYVLL